MGKSTCQFYPPIFFFIPIKKDIIDNDPPTVKSTSARNSVKTRTRTALSPKIYDRRWK